jgi:hypothetical protein
MSGRDEPMWIAIHKCMEATLGIALYSYPYLKLENKLYLSYYRLYVLFNGIREQEGRRGSTHVSKCENDKTKERKVIQEQ